MDSALLSEAHGLVTDMLTDNSLPPHVVSGLRALAVMLAPTTSVPSGSRVKPAASASVSLTDFNSGSDSEEIPYTGERPSALPKVSMAITSITARREACEAPRPVSGGCDGHKGWRAMGKAGAEWRDG